MIWDDQPVLPDRPHRRIVEAVIIAGLSAVFTKGVELVYEEIKEWRKIAKGIKK
jgi:hypothetical protein